MKNETLKRIEDFILRKVDSSDNSLFYYQKLRTFRNFVQRNYVRARSYRWFFKRNKPPVKNIYHAAVQKTASQWIRSVFSDTRIRKRTGLDVYPPHRYEFGEFRRKFPYYTFVPGLYIPYLLYREIHKPEDYATFYVIRDPRDIIVSWYHSMLSSHRLVNKQVKAHREKLQGLNKEDGLNYCIRTYQVKLSFMKSWVYHGEDDDSVLIVRFEDLTESPVKEFRRIFEHCGLSVHEDLFREVLNDYTKKKMRQKDRQRRADVSSNYSKNGSNWQEEFTEENLRLFNRVNGGLVDLLGYKKK